MAVEIPVYVNISDGIDAAIKQLPKEMPKLERAVGKNVLNIPLSFGKYGTIEEVLTSTTISAKELKSVLKGLEREFNNVSKAEANNARTSAKVKNLAKAYAQVEERLTGVSGQASAASMMTQNAINKVLAKIQKLQATMATVQRGSQAWNNTNYQLMIQQQRLGELNRQLVQYKLNAAGINRELGTQNSLLKNVAATFGVYASAHTLLRFVKQIRDVTGELEYQRVALGHLLQDQEFGNELFAKTVEAAKESPFRIKELVTYTKQLAAYRIEQDKLFETTQRLADISAGLGVDMNRLILAYGQVRAASVLRGQELRQFTEAGIPLVEELAKKFRELGREGTTTADVFKLISERAVPFEYIKEIFEEMTDAGGMFYRMQEEQAKTLKGRWEKLKDAYDQALMSIGNSETFQKWNDRVLGILNGIAKNLRGLVRITNAGAIAWAAYWLATKSGLSYGARLSAWFIKEYGLAKSLKMGIQSLTVAFKNLWKAVSGNWVGLALSALAGLITYFTTFKDKSKEAKTELSDIEKTIERMKEANKQLAFEEGLISRYEKLSKTTERTARQNELLASTMQELKVLFPTIADKIGDENIALEEQIRLLGKAATARREEMVDQAKKDLATQKEIIRGIEDEAAAAKAAYEEAQRQEESARTAEAAGGYVYIAKTGYRVVVTAEQLKNETIDAAAKTQQLRDKWQEVGERLATAKKLATELENFINPDQATKDLAEWQKQVINLQNKKTVPGDSPVFTDDDIKNFKSVYDLFGKLKKRTTDLDESIKGMTAALSTMKEGTKAYDDMASDIASAKRTKEIAEAIRALFGFDFSKKGGSDKRLSNLNKEINEITNAYKKFLELRTYKSDENALADIGVLFPQLKGFRPDYTNTVDRLKGMLADVKKKLAKNPKDTVLVDMQRSLETAISNIDFDKLKKELSDALKKLSDETKRSETARNFFNNMLDLTGDETIATNLTMEVYGQVGEDFKDRIQNEMRSVLASISDQIDADEYADLMQNIDFFDVDAIKEKIASLPDEIRPVFERLLTENEQFNADYLINFEKTYGKAKTYEQRIATIESQRDSEIKKAKAAGKTAEDIAAVNAKFDQDVANVQLEAMKDTYTWTKAFENLEGVSNETLNNLIDLLDEYIKKYGKDLEPNQKKELVRARERAEAQKMERNSLRATGDALKRYANQLAIVNMMRKSVMKGTEEYTKHADELQDAIKDLSDGMEQLISEYEQLASSAKDLMNVFATDEDASYFGEQMDNVSKGLSGAAKATVGIARMATGDFSPQAIISAVTGISDIITSIFGARNAARIRKYNKEIERQQELLDNLSYAYGRLEAAEKDAFGAEYIENYQQRLAVLNAEVEAYRKQAEAERKKGKKADEDKIKDLENQARDTKDAIEDMRSEISEKFLGSDLASASRDFASAWLDAYKEFGSTTGAIKEKFSDMIQSMVTESLAARIVEQNLEGIFKLVDELSTDDGQLSVTEAAMIAAKAQEVTGTIDVGLTNLMNALSATGLNLRSMGSGLTGISKDLAGASEESILGLAAGVNTQNYYISHIDQNVAAILSILGGSPEAAGGPATSTTLSYTSSEEFQLHMSNLDTNLAELLSSFKKVITPKNANDNTYCVAIK